MSEVAKSPELKEYRGNCHCGSFRYSVRLAPLKSVTACNCSICSKVRTVPRVLSVFLEVVFKSLTLYLCKNGYLWAFPGAKNPLTIEKGEGALKQYEFGNRTMAHEVTLLPYKSKISS